MFPLLVYTILDSGTPLNYCPIQPELECIVCFVVMILSKHPGPRSRIRLDKVVDS